MNSYAIRLGACVAFCLMGCFTIRSNAKPKPQLEVVASFPTQQVTGVAVSKQGRIFVNFPFWSDDHKISVAEVLKDGTVKPYPDEVWNRKDGPVEARWVCVQSVYVDDSDALWVLDPAAPKMEAVLKGGAKLVKFDLATNKAVQTIPFEEAFAPERSYLNDVRVDTKTGHAFLTESGLGALLVVDLNSGKKRRLFAGHPSTQAEDVELVVDGIKLIDPKSGKTPRVHADGIALDTERGYLYFHALTGHTLYRIKTEDLRNEQLDDAALASRIENLGKTPAPDGMLAGRNSTIYLTAFEKNAIARWNDDGDKIDIVIEDKRLQWPDSLSWGPDGALYVTTSQIHRTPKFNQGESKLQEPFHVYRVRLE